MSQIEKKGVHEDPQKSRCHQYNVPITYSAPLCSGNTIHEPDARRWLSQTKDWFERFTNLCPWETSEPLHLPVLTEEDDVRDVLPSQISEVVVKLYVPIDSHPKNVATIGSPATTLGSHVMTIYQNFSTPSSRLGKPTWYAPWSALGATPSCPFLAFLWTNLSVPRSTTPSPSTHMTSWVGVFDSRVDGNNKSSLHWHIPPFL